MDEAGPWYSENKLFSSGVVSSKSLSSKFLHPETTPTAVCGPKEHSQQGLDLCARQSCLMDRTLVSFSNGKSAEARGELYPPVCESLFLSLPEPLGRQTFCPRPTIVLEHGADASWFQPDAERACASA